jgi:hypothetical protein
MGLTLKLTQNVLRTFIDWKAQVISSCRLYLKSKHSIEKPRNEGPAAYVFPADDPRPGGQAELLRTLQLRGCEIVQAAAPFLVTIRKVKTDKTDKDNKTDASAKLRVRQQNIKKQTNQLRCALFFRRGPRSSSRTSSVLRFDRSVPKTWSTGSGFAFPFRKSAPFFVISKMTTLPGLKPSFARMPTGTVIWPLEEMTLFINKE